MQICEDMGYSSVPISGATLPQSSPTIAITEAGESSGQHRSSLPHQQVPMATDLAQPSITQDIPMIVADRSSKRKVSDTDFPDRAIPSKPKIVQATHGEGSVTVRKTTQEAALTLAKGEVATPKPPELK
ncbi:unnamed protein product [Arabidopsis thaliana]|uniref:Uncharacterized protein n=1 Tax=Arabidopsis thaliana TaxID=3702 RepID=A0A654G6C0_ARATH|nr:unnamed protein product [Arabidopsis thaliana]